jgi:hypothetical protein
MKEKCESSTIQTDGESHRNERLERLKRQHKCRHEWAKYRENLEGLLGLDLTEHFVNLDETDAMWARIIQRVPLIKRRYEIAKGELLFWQLSRSADALRGPIMMFNSSSHDCGAIRIDWQIAIRFAGPMLTLDRDDIYICTADVTEGMLISDNEDMIAGMPQHFYDVQVWGSQWAEIIRPFLDGVA